MQTSSYNGYNVVLVALDNDGNWKKYNYYSSDNVSMFTKSEYDNYVIGNLGVQNDNTYSSFLNYTKEISINYESYNYDTKTISTVRIPTRGGSNKRLFLDTNLEVYYLVSKDLFQLYTVMNLSKNKPGITYAPTVYFSKTIYLTNVSYNSKTYPVYAAMVTSGTTYSCIIFVPAITNDPFVMLMIQLLVNDKQIVSSVDLLSTDVDENDNPVLIYNFKQKNNNNVTKTYTSSISLETIINVITENINTTTYDAGVYPTVLEVL